MSTGAQSAVVLESRDTVRWLSGRAVASINSAVKVVSPYPCLRLLGGRMCAVQMSIPGRYSD